MAESTFILGTLGVILNYYDIVFDENSLSNKNSPKWGVAFCGVPSVAIFQPMSHKKGTRLK